MKQTYINSTFDEAVADGCDLVQPKYRGRWTKIEVQDGLAKCFAPDGSILTYVDVKNRELCCHLVGDLFGPPRHDVSTIVVWDCRRIGQRSDLTHWRVEWTDLTKFAYRDRYAFVKQQVPQIGLPFVAIRCYRMIDARELWQKAPEDVCGLIYRRMKDPASAPLRCARRYQELPGELP